MVPFAMSKLACVSIDLLGLPAICRRFRIPESDLPPAGAPAVGRRAPERFAELLDRAGAPASFFVEADDLDEPVTASAIAGLPHLGHELALLGPGGDEAFAMRPPLEIAAALTSGCAALARCGRERPTGFRAVAGFLSPALLEELEAHGFLYDASVHFGGPGGRAALLAPRSPYRPSPRVPLRRGSAKLVELPASTAGIPGVPLSGALLSVGPKSLAASIYRAIRRRRFVCLHLQGIDLLDESDGFGPRLVRAHRAFHLTAARKRQRLSEFLEWLRHDFELVTLEEASRRLAPGLGEPIG